MFSVKSCIDDRFVSVQNRDAERKYRTFPSYRFTYTLPYSTRDTEKPGIFNTSGKWHLGYCNENYLPTRRGFDSFFGEYAQQADHYTREHEVNRHIGTGYDLRRGENVSYENLGLYSTFLWEEETINILDKASTSDPWFLEVSLTAAHPPYQAPDKYIKMYERKNRRKKQKNNRSDQDNIRKAMITAIDDSVGRIIDKLKSTGLDENTLVVFSSDNGSGHSDANGSLRGKKGYVFEGGVRVPAFIQGTPLLHQMLVTPGYSSSALVHIVDWFPTLLRLSGEKLSNLETDGVDIWEPLTTGEISQREILVYNLDLDDQSKTFQFAVRKNNWKLIWGQTKEFKPHKKEKNELFLFNLARDPNETENLAESEPSIVQELKKIVKNLTKETRTAFHPNRFNLGFPKYHEGLLSPGWCGTGWWKILWNSESTSLGRFVQAL
ncbi:arylsulfatase I isoform X2 [Eurytemora carolleeae]|uniref:arylsulfatase I isoform X2 n=1 Tax=Eurytemora carolleeae TaxID=1294199 RepID=UPI000C78F1F2|nr:arylsulfatase I isoform X2 [Eurytemora carolleeae]|eukprot:XP_023320884.1 arylsulfatase I-like isoform X2 [Eurytemora affinis]